MRSKLIITGAIGVLAVATLTVNAQNASSKTTTGSVGTLLAASAQVVKADRDEVAIDTRVTASAAANAQSVRPAAAESEKTEVAARPAVPRSAIPAGCQSAIAALKSLHDADVAEDASERTAAAPTAAALAAERSEDLIEAQKWAAALVKARAMCLPLAATACQTAVAGLQPVLQTLRNEELMEQQSRVETDSASDVAAVRTAFSAVAMACLRPE